MKTIAGERYLKFGEIESYLKGSCPIIPGKREEREDCIKRLKEAR